MIKIENLSYAYTENNIIDNMNFNFSEGKIYRIVGNNGIGKTTLLKLIYGNLIPSEGKILRQCSDNKIFYLSNQLPLDHNLTVVDHINFVRKTFNIDRNIFKQKEYLLTELKINNFGNQYIENISLGTQKKVLFFLAYLIDYKVLLLDEFFSGIDKGGIEVISKAIKLYVQEGGTVIFVTHQDDESKYLEYTTFEMS
uniref:ABC transporter ATP-binding protein n=1 Tax=Leuconostoc lactis TaxID=1246 RepID=UPI001896F4AC|nr:ATP-binding cassette domain-containing protein [Leuconostoc lactis]